MKISIVILTYNQVEYTQKCIESIKRNTKLNYEMIVVDNASTDGTPTYLLEQEDIKVILNPENYGYAKGNNLGAKAADGDVIIFMNNDVVVTPNWLEPLIDLLYSDEKIGMVGPVTNNISGVQQIPVEYNQATLEGLELFANENQTKNSGCSKKVLRLVGYLLVCRRSLIDEIGAFDERFGLGNFEDDDICLRALTKGYSLHIAFDSFVHHYGSVSFRNSDIDYMQLMRNNQQIITDKWGFNPGYYMFSRPEVVKMVPSTITRVMEIGCGMGATALDLKEKYGAEVVGIEINSKVGEIAEHNLDKVIVGDIEQIDVSEQNLGRFDCIICADVLEHLRDPWSLLSKLEKLLSKQGVVIISVPNASNIEVLYELMQGNFIYKDSGILDRTHLRFFTRNTLSTLVQEGMTLEEIQTTTLNYSDEHKQFIDYLQRLGKKFGLNTDHLQTDAFSYQYLIRMRKI